MKAHCVLMIAGAPWGRLSIEIDMSSWPVIPQVGDTMFWNGDWGGHTVESRYVSSDGIELYLGRVGPHDVDSFIAAGWQKR